MIKMKSRRTRIAKTANPSALTKVDAGAGDGNDGQALSSEASPGAQLLDRAAKVLQLLGEDSVLGWKLSDLARAAGLSAPTCHRILSALARHQLVSQSPDGRLYRLGLEFFRLGVKAADGPGLRQITRPSLIRIAAATGDIALLMVRSGLNSVCVDRLESDYLIETLTGGIGGSVPLGVGTGSQAMMAYFEPAERAEIRAANMPRYGRFPHFNPDQLEDELAAVRERGYSLDLDGVMRGSSGFAVPIRAEGVGVIASLGIAALSTRLDPDKMKRTVALLHEEAARISPQINPLDRRLQRPALLIGTGERP